MEERHDPNTVELSYLKGFNEGYLIARHLPDLARRLEIIRRSPDARIEGVQDGMVQVLKDSVIDLPHGAAPKGVVKKRTAGIIGQQGAGRKVKRTDSKGNAE